MIPTAPRQIQPFSSPLSTRARCSRAPGSRARRRGLTLIEVAVALVIFVIGALAIIQIFPPALGVIQNSESRAVASRMADSTLSRLGDNPNLVPDAIYHTDGGVFNSPGSAVVGTATLNDTVPDGPQESYFNNSALAHFRRIVGERHKVRPLNTGGFVLTQFPYDPSTLEVYIEDEVRGVTIGSDGRLDFKNSYRSSDNTAFGMPSTTSGEPWRPLTTARSDNGYIYYVSYRWIEGGQTRGVVDEPIIFPPTWDPNTTGRVTAGLRDTAINPGPVIPGPVSVRYRAKQSQGAPPTGAPERGYLPLSGIAVGTQVSVDYTVADWRWLVDERSLTQRPSADTEPTLVPDPANTLYVKLPVRNLENEPLNVYGLVVNYIVDNSVTPTRRYYEVEDDRVIAADAEAGEVYYDPASLFAPQARTIYQTIDDWTHQLSVAAKSYVPLHSDFATTSDGRKGDEVPREPWREYFAYSSGGTTYLCFRAGEAGKTVAVSYAEGSTIINNRVLTISAEIQPASAYSIPAGFFTDINGNSFGPNNVAVVTIPSNVSLLSVRGLDIRARTAWLNGSNWTQTVLTGYRTR